MARIETTIYVIERNQDEPQAHVVKAYRTKTPGLVVHKRAGVLADGSWNITHRPSGFVVRSADFRTLHEAQSCAEKLGDLEVDWAASHEEIMANLNEMAPAARRGLITSINNTFLSHGVVW